MAIHRPVRLWRAQPQPGQSLEFPLAPGSRGWLQLIDGALALEAGGEAPGCPAQLSRGDGLGFEAGAAGLAAITATTPATATTTRADLLLFELR
jgi:redox-sensitive bicupin YhaK (pirin superfamily)